MEEQLASCDVESWSQKLGEHRFDGMRAEKLIAVTCRVYRKQPNDGLRKTRPFSVVDVVLGGSGPRTASNDASGNGRYDTASGLLNCSVLTTQWLLGSPRQSRGFQ
jgi:hypothetical protein